MSTRKKSEKQAQHKDQLSSVVMKEFRKFDKRFDKIERKLDEHDKRFDEHDRKFAFLVEKFMDHEDRLIRIEETMVTKTEFYELYNKIDSFLALYTKQDQEITIMGHQLHRHDQDIARIKLAINLT